MLDDELWEVLAQPLVRELVLRVGHLSLAQRALVLEISSISTTCPGASLVP
jgi:hypothetical protein